MTYVLCCTFMELPNTIDNINNMSSNTKKIKVSRKKNFRPKTKRFYGEVVANQLLLQSEFQEGKIAFVKCRDGKLTITIPNEIDKRLKRSGEHF